MSEVKNRRAEAEARGLLKRTETMVARASFHLFNGDPLSAMRVLRAAEQLNQLDGRLRTRRDAERKSRAALAESNIKERERACQNREELLTLSERHLNEQRAQIKQTEAAMSATYKLMREGAPDGPPPATDEETVSGVAPL